MKIWLPVIYLLYIYEDHPVNIQTIEISLKPKENVLQTHISESMQLKHIELDKKYPFVSKFTDGVGPHSYWRKVTQMNLCVDAVF